MQSAKNVIIVSIWKRGNCMANEINQQSRTKICPTCGTRMNESATRCLVCGRTFNNDQIPAGKNASAAKDSDQIEKPRLRNVSISVPIFIGLILLLIGIGAAVAFVLLQQTGRVVEPTPLPSATLSPTPTNPPTETPTPTMVMSPTPLAPIEYTVKDGDLCASIAAVFDVSVQSIILQNNLSASCYLSPGQTLLIPQPTITPTPEPTGTLTSQQATLEACGSYDHLVTNTDTLFGIALNYGVTTDIIRQYNGLTGDIVVAGTTIKIPLCERVTPGPTSTPTTPPPYAAPNLLLPADGTSYNVSGETITLQWAGVGSLLPNEAYEVVVEDVTEGEGRKLINYVTDTKFIVPMDFRPSSDTNPHVIRWYVTPVRQSLSAEGGPSSYEPAGARSESRTFIWTGVPVS